MKLRLSEVIFTVVLSLTPIIASGSVRADEPPIPNADLVCDPEHNVALARFVLSKGDEASFFATLPTEIDRGLSELGGSGHRDCKLANGWRVRLRNGQGQAFAYGMGGAAPGAFFSLWVEGRKVVSSQVWTSYDYSNAQSPLAGLVIAPSRITSCEMKADKPICTAKSFRLEDYAFDEIEYPNRVITDVTPPPDGSLIVTGSNVSICRAIIRRGGGLLPQGPQIGEPDIPMSSDQEEWIDKSSLPFKDDAWTTVYDLKGVFGLPSDARISYPQFARDFDGDGQVDSVIKYSDDRGYFDGSVFFVAPRSVPIIEMLRTLFLKDTDVEHAMKIARDNGWTVYSGGQPGLYPDVDPRYVHIESISYLGKYLFAEPTNHSKAPTAMVVKPRPGGAFDPVCSIESYRLHY